MFSEDKDGLYLQILRTGDGDGTKYFKVIIFIQRVIKYMRNTA